MWEISTLQEPCILPVHRHTKSLLSFLVVDFQIPNQLIIEYFHLFSRHGYETLPSLLQISNIEAIERIGIWRLGHQLRLLRFIKMLNRNCDFRSV